jgi:hypothetical protein
MALHPRWRALGVTATLVVHAAACGNDGDDPGRNDTTTSEGSATAQPTSFTASEGSTGGPASDTETDSDETDAGSTDTGTSELCPPTHACIPDIPTDWNGPVIRAMSSASSATRPECPETWPDVATEVFSDLVAPAATCGCECGPAIDVSCDPTLTIRNYGATPTCSDVVPSTFVITSSGCNLLPNTVAGSTYWTADPVQSVGGSCEPLSEVALDDAQFETRLLACGGAELLNGCATGNVCAPASVEGFESSLCVWREGDHTCPSSYARKELLFRDIDDQRGCQQCTCGDPRGLCNSALVRLWQSGCGATTSGIISANGECAQQASNPTQYVTVTPNEPTSFCTPSSTNPVGQASGRDPVSVCCRP